MQVKAEQGGIVVTCQEGNHRIVDVDVAVAEVDTDLSIAGIGSGATRGCGQENEQAHKDCKDTVAHNCDSVAFIV